MDSRARFEALYRAHCGAVRSFAHRRVSSAVADDVMADVFALAWRRLDKAPGDELSWLLGIARGVLANRRRCDARQQALRDRLAANAVPAIPGTHRTALEWRCRRNVKALAK
jgi:DNA-directed RNA polymerase specialized sigma24 family protein